METKAKPGAKAMGRGALENNEGDVLTWTDKEGHLHITDQPPPEGANVSNVTTYKPQSEKKVLENQRQQQMRENAAERKRKLAEAQNAELKAQKAAEEAKTARDRVDAVDRDAKESVTASVVTAQLGNEPIYTTLLKRTLANKKSAQ